MYRREKSTYLTRYAIRARAYQVTPRIRATYATLASASLDIHPTRAPIAIPLARFSRIDFVSATPDRIRSPTISLNRDGRRVVPSLSVSVSASRRDGGFAWRFAFAPRVNTTPTSLGWKRCSVSRRRRTRARARFWSLSFSRPERNAIHYTIHYTIHYMSSVNEWEKNMSLGGRE